jgi:hypothetical protein
MSEMKNKNITKSSNGLVDKSKGGYNHTKTDRLENEEFTFRNRFISYDITEHLLGDISLGLGDYDFDRFSTDNY